MGVTALGISGTNAHVVLEEGPPPCEAKPDSFAQWTPALCVPLSAGSPEALRRLTALDE